MLWTCSTVIMFSFCCCFVVVIFLFCFFFSNVPEEFSLSEDKFVKFVKKRKSAEKLCTYIYLLHKTSRPVEHFWKLFRNVLLALASWTCYVCYLFYEKENNKLANNWALFIFYSESKELNYISYRQVSLQRSLSFHPSVIATNLTSCLAA